MTERFIMVDKDGDCIRVYPANEDSDDAESREFWRDDFMSASHWKCSAENFAAQQAAKINGDWGCNY